MPPTSRSAGLPAPFAAWQARHFATYTASPCLTVPLPAGSPAPLGGMLMSHAAISCGVASRPRPGPAGRLDGPVVEVAQASTRVASTMAAITFLKIDIAYASVSFDHPRLDRIVVVALLGHVFREPRRARGLHVSFLVDGPALQLDSRAVPLPRQAKTSHALREYRLLQHRLAPTRAAVE